MEASALFLQDASKSHTHSSNNSFLQTLSKHPPLFPQDASEADKQGSPTHVGRAVDSRHRASPGRALHELGHGPAEGTPVAETGIGSVECQNRPAAHAKAGGEGQLAGIAGLQKSSVVLASTSE